MRNRCPSGQKAFIVLFRYGRRHKRGRPNSNGCRFCNERVRSPIEKTDDHSLTVDRNPMKLLRNTRAFPPRETFYDPRIPWKRENERAKEKKVNEIRSSREEREFWRQNESRGTEELLEYLRGRGSSVLKIGKFEGYRVHWELESSRARRFVAALMFVIWKKVKGRWKWGLEFQRDIADSRIF